MSMHRKHFAPTSIRNFVFGVEDALVSTVGLLSGIAVAGVTRDQIVLTGSVLIAVEALSMAVGSFLSEDVAEEAENKRDGTLIARDGAVVMFFSYILAGILPLIPYLFSTPQTLLYSISLSGFGLLALGVVSHQLFHIPVVKSTVRILVLGGGAVVVGVLVGQFLSTLR